MDGSNNDTPDLIFHVSLTFVFGVRRYHVPYHLFLGVDLRSAHGRGNE